MVIAATLPVENANLAFERNIRAKLGVFPEWLLRAARVAKIVVSNRPDVQAQIAMFEHDTRILWVSPGVGDLLRKALGHELFHAIDDVNDSPHFFSGSDTWLRIHRAQPYFDIDKYRAEPLEYFGDQGTKYLMLGETKLATTNAKEAEYIGRVVIPTIRAKFGG